MRYLNRSKRRKRYFFWFCVAGRGGGHLWPLTCRRFSWAEPASYIVEGAWRLRKKRSRVLRAGDYEKKAAHCLLLSSFRGVMLSSAIPLALTFVCVALYCEQKHNGNTPVIERQLKRSVQWLHDVSLFKREQNEHKIEKTIDQKWKPRFSSPKICVQYCFWNRTHFYFPLQRTPVSWGTRHWVRIKNIFKTPSAKPFGPNPHSSTSFCQSDTNQLSLFCRMLRFSRTRRVVDYLLSSS